MSRQPFPAVQVVDRPKPFEAPADFCPWQFVMWQPGRLSKDAETRVMALLISLLEDVVRLRLNHYALSECPRELVENVVAELNEHCEDIHAAIVWCYGQLQGLMAA